MTGKYVIVCLLKGECAKYHSKIVNKIADNYGIKRVSDSIAPHITLKYFNNLLTLKDIKELEDLIKHFCLNQKKQKFKLHKINHFGKKVIFIDVKASEEMKILYHDLVKELEKLNWMHWNKYDKENMHFHSTLAETDDDHKFDEIYDFVSKENPEFDIELDNITILTKLKDKWIIYKEFNLN